MGRQSDIGMDGWMDGWMDECSGLGLTEMVYPPEILTGPSVD